MSLRFEYEWTPAPTVPVAELSATWCRLAIYVGDTCLTLFEERPSGEVRKSLDVAIYPLAEWIAYNWWFLNTTSTNVDASRAAADRDPTLDIISTHRFDRAGSGFPWPAFLLIPERGAYLASMTARNDSHQRLRFLSHGEFVLDGPETRKTLAAFVNSVTRRLEDHGITKTKLQEEWAAIESANPEQVELCHVAASLGLDPYDLDDEVLRDLLDAGNAIPDIELLSELMSGVALPDAGAGWRWLDETRRNFEQTETIPSGLSISEIRRSVAGRTKSFPTAWGLGWHRAQLVRSALGLTPTTFLDLDGTVLWSASTPPPRGTIQALGGVTTSHAAVAADSRRDGTSRRFLQARTLSRALFDNRSQFLITDEAHYFNRVERAFAAELLAPASGVRELLDSNEEPQSRLRVASKFGVDPVVIDRQVENQLTGSIWKRLEDEVAAQRDRAVTDLRT